MRDYQGEIAAYLEEIKNRKKDGLDEIIDKVKNFKYVCIFGAGMTAHSLISSWKMRTDQKIDFVCDNDEKKWGKPFHGQMMCISPDELKRYGKDLVVVIASRYINEIYAQLREIGVQNIFYRSDYRLANSDYPVNENNLQAMKHNLLQLMDILEDVKSKDVLLNMVRIWFDYDVTNQEYSAICTGNQYFPGDIVELSPNESFVDAGAYNGDTLIDFLQHVKYSFNAIYSFELDKENFQELQRCVDNINEQHIKDKINLYNFGVYNEEKSIFYEHGGDKGADSHINDHARNQGKTTRLSDILKGKEVSFIKMDVEGAELAALDGAEGLIKKDYPTLAICVYHKPEHLWEIPFYIKQMVPGYKLYLRHHSNLEFETVCYAVYGKE